MASEQHAAGTPAAPVIPLVGIGTDIHAFEEGRELWCAGLKWEGEGPGLAGHSDADVVAHAACNALFSAAGLGDLGQHFGTGRPEWSGAAGITLLTEAARIVRAGGFEIGNVAVQVVGASQGGGASAYWMYVDVPTTRRGAVAVVVRPPGIAGQP
ncbi:2-C-methyl-D-erythritol 2,4-cyclodiphosphate synthase [Streptomyces anulatus]|uniref:2-C-methyl-D-erythritol 2,4-cyclodiphosphate synthase n=1 Tax=Streptomyces anulatus TaxID=1892 RepID=UPI000AE32B2C|nr:2-C-methyl-D-erythritol 2,4-cyclodiphosphate synthase [Streptomyces anulatus]